MGIFDFFKKDQSPDYDPSNIKVTDFKKGFVFDYDLKSWVVKKAYEYDWGNNNFSLEFVIENENESYYMSVEEDDEVEISLSKKIKLREIDEDLPEYIQRHETPPKTLDYKGKRFFMDGESMGSMREIGQKEISNLISWDFYSEDEKEIISIEQWGENDFEASKGFYVDESEFSNIYPA